MLTYPGSSYDKDVCSALEPLRADRCTIQEMKNSHAVLCAPHRNRLPEQNPRSRIR